MRTNFILEVALITATLSLQPLPGQRFLPDDPIQTDHDRLPFPEPTFVELSPSFDMAENTFGNEGKGPPSRAVNVNTLGEVPDSSWFTNRLGITKPPIEDWVQGGLREGPDMSGTITVTGAALIALTAGLVIRDCRENLYYIKFDPLSLPSLATASDHITSRFMYAFGYNVLPTSIAYLDPSRIEVAPSAVVRVLGGQEKPLDQEFIRFLLEQAHPGEDGRYRVVAHPLPPGNLLGGFKFFGTRGDDANDVFPHQDRRELRGLRVFSAWLNHVYCRALNTMDVFIPEVQGTEPLGWVKHYLIDFSTSLGSGYDLNEKIVPKEPQDGHEYTFWGDHAANLKTALSLGLWERPWMKIEYPYPRLAEIGRIEVDHFIPDRWKPDYPNAAFDKMLPDDAFWAAKILARVSNSAIRAVVREGAFSDPEAERYLADTLISRRDKLLQHYFHQINPLDKFEIVDQALLFDNLGPNFGLPLDCSYQYLWHRFDNGEDELTTIGPWRYTGLSRIPIPETTDDYLMVRIRTRAEQAPNWLLNIDVYLHQSEQLKIVGIDREIGVSAPEKPE